MSTREKLQQQHLSPKKAEDVIERAALLQERARNVSPGQTLQELKTVGAELDIEDRFVDAAVAQLKEEEELAARQVLQRGKMLRSVAMAIGAVMVSVFALGGVGSLDVRRAAQEADLARANLETVVQRQTSLVPQLLALSGGDASGLTELQRAVEDAKDVDARLKAADALQFAMAQALGKLPPSADANQGQQRLSLQHELVGATNRVTTERRRYDQAMVKWRGETSGGLGALATALRLAPSPPR